MPVTYAVVGGGVVGCAVTLALARRGRSVTLFEAEREVGLPASGTNSGILRTGFDSHLGELETALILRAAPLRDEAILALGIPVRRCGARMRNAPAEVEQSAQILGVPAVRDGNDVLVPDESVTNPVAMTEAFCAEAERVGASLRLGQRVVDDLPDYDVVVNCAGLFADEVARTFGDDSFEIAPRKGEFLVFPDTDPGLTEILLPVPTPRTKGILVFPTLDGHICCGPTAVDVTDKSDWSVREEAREALHEQARGMDRLLNVAAIRSTGLTAALGIADYVCSDLLGIDSTPVPYRRGTVSVDGLWWRRTAEYRGLT